MSSTLLRVASKHNSVISVVGKGHLQGMKKHWKQPIEQKIVLKVDMYYDKCSTKALKVVAIAEGE
ncbi:hypothetical protein GIB67_003397, partial [Kingdonia uniflora]